MFKGLTTRRGFMDQGLGLLSVGAVLPNFLIRTALAGPTAQSDQSVLVVLQLSGGNDGLSTIVPYGMDEYQNARQVTRIAPDDVIKLDEQLGLHPNLTPFKQLLDDGQLAVVQGVGYPNPNQSHFTSMDIWHLADPEARTSKSSKDTSAGWLGRYADVVYKGVDDPKIAMAVGGDRVPLAIVGKEHPGISFRTPDSYRFIGDRGDKRRAKSYQQLNMSDAQRTAMAQTLDFVCQTAENANQTSDEIRTLASKYQSPVEYPRNSLASSLKTVAGLIAGGLNTRIYYVFHGGYDTHAGQRARHDRLMSELSESVAAFQKDLKYQNNDQRVLTMSFSEFGRRFSENASDGTDHGMAGPMFLFGPSVKPGLHGRHPSLRKDDLVIGRDLKFEIDFRSVYAAVLEKWLSTKSQPILGAQLPLVDCIA